jgi:NAD(P)-dependent dehydrogenase (short-subunit alcohol dehydrogenase family)
MPLNPYTSLGRTVLGVAGIAGGLCLAQRIRTARSISFQGKVVLITGGSRGLGLLLAREFGRLGAKIAICARNPSDLDRAEQDLQSRGIEVKAMPCDVSIQDDVGRVIHQIVQHYGQIDVLVNNAGSSRLGR